MMASPNPTATPAQGPLALAPVQLSIVGVGLHCPAGDQAFALFGAVAAGLSCARKDPYLSAASPDGLGEAPVLRVQHESVQALEPAQRMQQSLAQALEQALTPQGRVLGDLGKSLCVVLVPGSIHSRGQCLGTDSWHRQISLIQGWPEAAQIRVIEQTQSATAHLLELIQDEAACPWDTLIFGAVDSLVDELTCQELARAGRIRTQQSDGVLPGEAASVLILQRGEQAAGRALAKLTALAVAPEPHPGQADSRALTGLGQAMEAAIALADMAPADLDALVLTLGTDTAAMLEWYQTETRLWPTRLGEAEQVAIALGEQAPQAAPDPKLPERLNLNLTLGEIGAASLPVAVALACERLGYGYPGIRHCLVTEGGALSQRGALLLSAVPRGAEPEHPYTESARHETRDPVVTKVKD